MSISVRFLDSSFLFVGMTCDDDCLAATSNPPLGTALSAHIPASWILNPDCHPLSNQTPSFKHFTHHLSCIKSRIYHILFTKNSTNLIPRRCLSLSGPIPTRRPTSAPSFFCLCLCHTSVRRCDFLLLTHQSVKHFFATLWPRTPRPLTHPQFVDPPLHPHTHIHIFRHRNSILLLYVYANEWPRQGWQKKQKIHKCERRRRRGD